jgi:hypothetical protein
MTVRPISFAAKPATLARCAAAQRKVQVGPVDDPLEREADRVADAVVSDRAVGSIAGAAAGTAQRKCADCERDEMLRRASAGGAGGDRVPADEGEAARAAVSGGGAPLSAAERAYFEPRFGQDLSHVRLHAGPAAQRAAASVNARAFAFREHIAFASGKYASRTHQGRHLLAHELAHVVQQSNAGSAPVLQRKDGTEAPALPSFPGSVTFRGCEGSPGRLNFVRQRTISAFETARDGDCIKSESLKRDILASFEGLTVDCKPEVVEGQCAEAKKGEGRIVLSKLGLDGATGCPPLDAAIFHEVVHLAEGWNIFHGNLSYDCGKACFPNTGDPRGDPSGCGNETGWAPFGGASGGAALTGKGSATGYARLYIGLEHRGPVLSLVRPSLGIGASLIGSPDSGKSDTASERSTLLSVMGALRVDPGKDGGLYVSFGGGLGTALGRGGIGYDIGAKFGYRWSVYDVSFDAGVNYDPTRNAGEQRLYTLGASFQVAPRIR